MCRGKTFPRAQVNTSLSTEENAIQKSFGEILRTAVNEMAKLQLTRQEKEFLKKIVFILISLI